jgi:hypothetical protein
MYYTALKRIRNWENEWRRQTVFLTETSRLDNDEHLEERINLIYLSCF